MTGWEDSGGIKVKRAEKHIRDLETEIDAFEKRSPYGIWPDQDQEPGALLIRARITEQPDIRWGAIAGDAIHNLRSALDVLWRLAMYPDRDVTDDRGCGFAIYKSAKAFESANRRKVGGARKRAMEVYRSLEPYKGGNDALWRLHRLNIADKHHILLPVVAAVQHKRTTTLVKYSRMVDAREIVALLPLRDQPRIIYAPEDGAILRRITPGVPNVPAEMNVDTEFTFHVTLGQDEVRKAEPIVDALNHFMNVVKDIAQQFIAVGAIS